ncbi:MAG: hypothetical protein AAF739_09165 [Pseudomonadota bacterium]
MIGQPGVAYANDWQLISSPGECSYVYERITDERTTRCTASAIIMNTATSQITRCTASVEGNQFLAPSVEENVPEEVTCWTTPRVINGEGPYAISSLDDAFIEENTRVRRRGNFVWSNAFWVYATSGTFDIRLCAANRAVQNPDLAQRCSQRINWASDQDRASETGNLDP